VSPDCFRKPKDDTDATCAVCFALCATEEFLIGNPVLGSQLKFFPDSLYVTVIDLGLVGRNWIRKGRSVDATKEHGMTPATARLILPGVERREDPPEFFKGVRHPVNLARRRVSYQDTPGIPRDRFERSRSGFP
jgi:hypothetical protein